MGEIKDEVERRAATIGASGHSSLPTYGRSEDFARPHVEADSRGYHLIVVERGQEQSHLTTTDLDELLYHIFSGVTFSLATEYELKHRAEDQDARRIMFKKQVELLSHLSEHWEQRENDEHEKILRKFPFDDLASVRARLSVEVGWAKACEKYPLPKAGDGNA